MPETESDRETRPRADETFESYRPLLFAIAYRMLGSAMEAEDVVQDAYLRWSTVDQAAIDNPRAYLARVVSRLCLDRMKSARAQREMEALQPTVTRAARPMM